MPSIHPKLTLVGAGPGDPDLITLKGIKSLQAADVVLFDALVSPEILDYAPSAKKIFVGKRKGFKAYSQEKINEMIVREAFQNGHVVRLKGGDPFVFGRGTEEIDHAQTFGIEAEIIPGITSSVAGPSSLGIAVTQRHVSQSVWILTGTTSESTLAKDIETAATTTATLVVLMGMSKLPSIVSIFKSLGKHQAPIAIVQNATLPTEKSVATTIENIEEEVARENLSNPAVIVIGEVVRHSYQLQALFAENDALKIA